MATAQRFAVLHQYRKFVRLLRWWPEQREDEGAMKIKAFAAVQQEFRSGRGLTDEAEIEKGIQRAIKEYQFFVNIGSNLYRDGYKRNIEHVVPEEAKRAAYILSKEVQEKVAKGKWGILDKLSNVDMPEAPVVRK